MRTNDQNPYVQEAKYASKGEPSGKSYSTAAAFPITSLLERVQYAPRRSLYDEQRVSYIA